MKIQKRRRDGVVQCYNIKNCGIRRISTMEELKIFWKRHGIVAVPKESHEMFGYDGLHYMLNKEFGLRIPFKTIWYDKNLKGELLLRTLKHETEEMLEMMCGKHYFPAHRVAFRDEMRK